MSSWRSFLLRISDKCSEYGSSTDFKEHIETCYGVVRRELEHSGNDILPYLLQCVEQLPYKIPLYGTVVGLLNLENEDFIRKVVEYTQTNLQDALYSENCNRIRIFMRFLTVMMCSKVLQPSSLVAVFETLLSSAATTVDEEKGNPSWQPRADFYVSCILSSLPWGGAELTEQVPEEIDRIMVGVESYLSLRRSVSDVGLSCFEDGDEIEKGLGVKDDVHNEEGIGEKDLLKDLWARIRLLSRNGWKLDSVPRPHLSFEAQLVSGKSHELGPISCPEQPNLPSTLSGIAFGKQKHDAELKYPQRIRRLNIFPASKTEELQPIDRFIVEEYLLDILLFFNGSRKECIQFMASLHVPFRYEYLMAETIFSQLLLLPHPPFKPLYYTLVIIDLCKALPGAFPSVVAGAVRALFEKIADLDMECRTRLILWFSHHLSNFQFIWPWEEWAFVIDLPKWAPQRVFVQEVLDRQVRLSYREKVKQSIENAPVLNELLPPKGVPNFRYSIKDDTERIEEHTLSDELSLMVKEKQTAREVISWIEVSVFPVHGSEVTLKIVVQTLLDIGSKSFTHLVTILERYGQVLSHLCPDEDKQVLLIEEVASYWKDSSQMRAIVIDRMMNYRLVSNLSVVRWVFTPENIDQFHTSDHPWEVLRSAIGKTYNLISDLRKGIPSLAKSVVSAEEAVAKANAEVEAAESKLTLMDGEPVVGENPVRLKRLKSYAEKAKDDEASARKSLREKEAFLGRAIGENEALFVYLYKSFSKVLNERLPESVTLEELKSSSSQGDAMAVDVDVDESAAAMEVEDGNERPNTRQLNGEGANNGYNVGEKEQLCLSTLGYVKAFSRQYASEIWPIVEKLDAEVLTENGHPLFKKAVYSGLRR